LRSLHPKLQTFVATAIIFCAVVGSPRLAPAAEVQAQFSLNAPDAKAVFVAGEFNHWSKTATPLQRGEDGKWRTTMPLPPGKHAYKFIVDGEWKVDDANPEQTPDGFGGMNSILTLGDPGADAGVLEKDAVQREALSLFAKGDFAQLESTADSLRQTKARFSDGLWKLKEFYHGLTPERELGDQKDWQPWFDKLEKWKEQFPNSMIQPVVLAGGWMDYMYETRESEVRNDRLGKARAILEAASGSPRCPQWYFLMQKIALRQNWERDDYEKLFVEAATAEPTYYNYYANAADYFLSRSGDRAELDRIASEAARLDSGEGMAAYARTVWFMENRYTNVFDETTVTWTKLREGFLDIQKRYPDSLWNANAFCRFAVQAKDRQTAGLLFERIGDHADPSWGGYGRYQMARMWADPSTPSWRVEPQLTIQERHKAAVHSIKFSPDGKLLAGGTSRGRIVLWDAGSGKEVWSAQVAPFPVVGVAFSPDGKLIAAGAGETYRSKEPGIAKVWDVATKEEIASASPKGVVWKVAFTPDGKTLALSGGLWQSQAESTLLDLSTNELRALPWAEKHDHILKGVAISPDGKTLVADCYQSITVWSLVEDRVVFDTRNVLKCFVLSLAFSPDGKTLVTCGAPMLGHNDNEPGELTLWDTATWKPRNPRTQTEAAGLVGVAYSPDGKLIAGGGYDKAVHVWDAASLESKAIYLGHEDMIWTVAFSPDNKTVASGSDDGTVRFWKLP